MTILLATSVVRGSQQGSSHGGIYLFDTNSNKRLQPVNWNSIDIDWQGRGWDRGLRGIAFLNNRIFIAASDEIFEFDLSFQIVQSFKNPYLKHCHEICIYGQHLFITSTGFDCILGLNLETEQFDWGLQVLMEAGRFGCARFDPRADHGPMRLNKLHINNVSCLEGGMYISGLRTAALLRYDGRNIGIYSTLPKGVHNARPFLNGLLFNDTNADALRHEAPDRSIAYRIPRYPDHKLTHKAMDGSSIARQAFGRGLCVISEGLVAGGSSPSTITIYDLDQEDPRLIVNFTMDVRSAIHGLEVWPHPWPEINEKALRADLSKEKSSVVVPDVL